MQTIRGRLTVWYSAALVLTLTAFAIVLYVARRRASYDDLDQRIRSEADLTAAILGESYRARGVLVTYDSTRKPALVADIKAVLEAVPLLADHRPGRRDPVYVVQRVAHV